MTIAPIRALALILFVTAPLAWALGPSPSFGQAADQASPQSTEGGRYQLVTADREVAWRLDRVTGEMMICRLDTLRVDAVTATCRAAEMPQQAVREQRVAPEQQQQGALPRERLPSER